MVMSARQLCRGQLPEPLWMVVCHLPRLCTQGFRQVQYFSLLLTRSYRGLIPGLNWWDRIDEQFYLGGALMFDDIERLQSQGIRAVVNLCAEREDDQQRLTKANMTYLRIPVIDMCAPTLAQIDQGMKWIECQLRLGHTLYIHCAAGVGRSATLLACWYIYAHDMTVPQVILRLKTRHPQVSLTRRQIHRLRGYAKVQSPSISLALPPDSAGHAMDTKR